MRSIVLAAVLSLAACATSSTNRPVNVHSVRVDITTQIKGDREIVSMGKVTAASAEVYTQRSGQPRRHEMWTKASGGWQLQDSQDVVSAQ